MKKWKRWICGALLIGLNLQLAACASVPVKDQTELEQTEISGNISQEDAAVATADFSVALLQNSAFEEENCIISPYSILIAMAMSANGADGNTLAQMESAFGMPIADLNRWLSSLCEQSGSELISANSIWFRQEDGFELTQEFVQTNEDYFDAQIVSAPFDAQTLENINGWVSERTDGRIPSILDSLDAAALMVLVNALTFDAAWQTPYREDALFDGQFTAADGTVQDVTMMRGEENVYLDDGKATGFLKSYEGDRYAYAALLPNEGVSMQEYVASLSGEKLLALLNSASNETVKTQMPAYKAETFADMADALQAMGITDAFSPNADFGKISDQPMCIEQVLHKTCLKVHAGGTEAAAATAVVMEKSAMINKEYKEVILNRPYVMAIVDRETNAIVFLGVVNSIDASE